MTLIPACFNFPRKSQTAIAVVFEPEAFPAAALWDRLPEGRRRKDPHVAARGLTMHMDEGLVSRNRRAIREKIETERRPESGFRISSG